MVEENTTVKVGHEISVDHAKQRWVIVLSEQCSQQINNNVL